MRIVLGLIVVCLLVVTGTVLAAEPDEDRPFAFGVSERPAVGVTLGAASNGNALMGGGTGPEVGFTFETPFAMDRRIRFDATRTAWTAVYDGVPPASDPLTLTTVRLSVTKVQHWSEGSAGYAGLGCGGYRYGYERAPIAHPWRGGVFGLAGFEVLDEGHSWAFTGEVRFHVANGPREGTYRDVAMFKGEVTVGVKKRL